MFVRLLFMLSPALHDEGIMSSGRPSVRLSVNTYFARRGISVLIAGISIKPATNIHHVSESALLKSSQGQMSEVKFISRPINL